jgi:hypothetical protein
VIILGAPGQVFAQHSVGRGHGSRLYLSTAVGRGEDAPKPRPKLRSMWQRTPAQGASTSPKRVIFSVTWTLLAIANCEKVSFPAL